MFQKPAVRTSRSTLMTMMLLTLAVASARAETETLSPEEQKVASRLQSIKWQQGPVKGGMNGIASIDVPAGYRFAVGGDVKTLMEIMGNLPSGQEVGFITPDSMEWFGVFEYSPVGYVKDDDKNALDAAAMLESIRKGTDAGNEERKKRGWATMKILGWQQPPRYDSATNNLEWAIKAESEGSQIVNHNTRLLGRNGVMEVALVVDPQQLPVTLPTFRNLMSGYTFDPGQRYAEYRKGDKMAEYGLAALVTGGAAVAVAKSGFLAKFGKGFLKILIFVAIACAGLFRKMFGKRETAEG